MEGVRLTPRRDASRGAWILPLRAVTCAGRGVNACDGESRTKIMSKADKESVNIKTESLTFELRGWL
jgi:hypothetical protein